MDNLLIGDGSSTLNLFSIREPMAINQQGTK